jgi:hypothetical protein
MTALSLGVRVTILPGLSFRALRCHPEPFACHSERSEESRSAAQGKLREEPVLNEVKESRSAAQGKLREESRYGCFQGCRSCPSSDGHPETMKIERRWTDVVRASRPH